jgi:hypothetical protein
LFGACCQKATLNPRQIAPGAQNREPRFGQDFARLGGLAGADLADEQTVRRQQIRQVWPECPVRIEPIQPADERRAGLVKTDIVRELFPIGLRDLGRIGHDDIE